MVIIIVIIIFLLLLLFSMKLKINIVVFEACVFIAVFKGEIYLIKLNGKTKQNLNSQRT